MNINTFKYKGFTYTEFIDGDEDKSWYEHSVTYLGDNGVERVGIDYSKYCKMTETAFKLLVDLDFPSRPFTLGSSIPWNEGSLVKYKEELDYTRYYTINHDELTHL